MLVNSDSEAYTIDFSYDFITRHLWSREGKVRLGAIDGIGLAQIISWHTAADPCAASCQAHHPKSAHAVILMCLGSTEAPGG